MRLNLCVHPVSIVIATYFWLEIVNVFSSPSITDGVHLKHHQISLFWLPGYYINIYTTKLVFNMFNLILWQFSGLLEIKCVFKHQDLHMCGLKLNKYE